LTGVTVAAHVATLRCQHAPCFGVAPACLSPLLAAECKVRCVSNALEW